MRGRLATAILSLSATLSAFQGEADLRAIQSLELDPERCYRVRDVFLEREDIKLYFTDGHLVFAKPVLGRTLAALFLATTQTDLGEVLVVPPTPSERQSVARFLGETIVNEKFRNAMMFFTDDTPAALEEAVRHAPLHRLDPEQGSRIAPRWSLVLRNLIEGSAPRVLLDLYSGRGSEHGFFVAAIRGGEHGRFDVVVDPSLPEQVVVGQLVHTERRSYFNEWCRFESRSARAGKFSPAEWPASLLDYRIDARIGSDLRMDVKVAATLEVSDAASRAIGFDLSGRLAVTALRIDGEPVEFLQRGTPVTPNRRGDDALVIAFPPEPLEAGKRYAIEFEYSGQVISHAGSGVYFVGSRRNWYPRAGIGPTHYDLRFHYSPELELVATGRRVEDSVDGGMRTSRFRSERPIRLAGFNLGDYTSAGRDVDGFRVEVRATKSVEARLQKPQLPIVLPPTTEIGRRRNRRETPVFVMPTPSPADPSGEIERIADESAAAFRHFLRLFGEPAMPVTVISPVPGGFGQGLPGLVYASTLSYFEPGDEPLRDLSTQAQRFYADMMRPHEIAHQWWGNVATAMLDRDAWIMEALATYSSLLWIEEQGGVSERNAALAGFRQNLLRKSGKGTVESAGPIVLGQRLRTAETPEAYRVIVYEKGAWIVHMLRGILGDDSFFALLRGLCEGEGADDITTEGLRERAAQFVPRGYHDPELREFFDQWVYATGIPRISANWKQSRKGGRHAFELRLEQEGVPEYFPLSVQAEVHTLPGRSLVKSVMVGDGSESGFSVVLRNPASRVVIDPGSWVLAETP